MYQTILPKGVCLDVLNNVRISQSQNVAIEKNIALRIFIKEAVPIVLLLLKEGLEHFKS